MTIQHEVGRYEPGVHRFFEDTATQLHREIALHSSMGIGVPEKFSPDQLDVAIAAYDKVTSEPSYLGGLRKATLMRTTTFYERLKG